MCETEIDHTEEDEYEQTLYLCPQGGSVIKTAALLLMKDIISRKSVTHLYLSGLGAVGRSSVSLLCHFKHFILVSLKTEFGIAKLVGNVYDGMFWITLCFFYILFHSKTLFCFCGTYKKIFSRMSKLKIRHLDCFMEQQSYPCLAKCD